PRGPAGGRRPPGGVRAARPFLPSADRAARREPGRRGDPPLAEPAPVPAHAPRGHRSRRGSRRPPPRARGARRGGAPAGRGPLPRPHRPPPGRRTRALRGHAVSRRGVAPWLRVAPTGFVLAWGGNHFTPLLHVYETVGGYAPWQANLLLGMYVVGLVPGMLLAAALSDRHGRRPLAVVGLLSAALASALLALGMGSFPVLCLGRAIAGIGVGIGMSVGSSWIKELSAPPHEAEATPTAGARRSSMTLTLGFAIGAGATGSLAQWAPLPGQLPYLAHLLLCLVAAAALPTAPESHPRSLRARGSLREDLRVPSAGHPIFRRLALPAAPWVFAAARVAYAILPRTVEDRLGRSATMYAPGLTVLTLGVGALAQGPVALLNRLTRGRALLVGMSGMAVGMALAALA